MDRSSVSVSLEALLIRFVCYSLPENDYFPIVVLRIEGTVGQLEYLPCS